MTNNTPQIRLNYTVQEWSALTNIANTKIKKDIRIWLSLEIKQFAKRIAASKICVDCNDKEIIRKANVFDIPYEHFHEINCLARSLGIYNTTLIQRFIIDRYLSAYIEEKGFLIT